MKELIVSNSTCQIRGISKETLKILKINLRYEDTEVRYSLESNIRKLQELRNAMSDDKFKVDQQETLKECRQLQYKIDALTAKLYVNLFDGESFPTGLLPRALKLLEKSDPDVKLIDTRKKPVLKTYKFALKNNFPVLRYYQKEAANELLKYYRGVVEMPTGTGKTTVIAKMIWDLGVKTLVITPSKNITKMMIKTLEYHFGKSKVQKLDTKSSKTKEINVVNIQALVRLPPELLKDIDAVFIDEFHHAAADTYQLINVQHLKNCYYRIGCTATNFRNDGADIALEGVLSEVLYSYSLTQAFKDKVLVQPEFEIIENDNMYEYSYKKEYANGIVENTDRNRIISEIALERKGDSIIILVQQKNHGRYLQDLIPDSIFINGDEKDSFIEKHMEDFKKGKLKVLIGTSVIGEGVDLPRANVLIMAGGGKARSQIMQNIGRVLRLYPGKEYALVFDFTDYGSRYLEPHAEERRSVYEMYL